MKISRRDFVAYSSGLFSSFIPFIDFKFLAQSHDPVHLTDTCNILVLVHLAGGNDWFNTVIPYQSASYYRERPSISIAPAKVLGLDELYAVHPELTAIKKLYEQDKVALLLNVGSPEQTLSHGKASQYWQYAGKDKTWQRDYADYVEKNKNVNLVFPSINVQACFSEINSNYQQKKIADRINISSLDHSNNFEFDLDIHYKLSKDESSYLSQTSLISKFESINLDRMSKRKAFMVYSGDGFTEVMKLVATSIKQKTNATIYNISLGGFDTHVNQLDRHAQLLQSFSEGLLALQSSLENAGLADRVMTLVYSEFGRSLKENDHLGTDHGHNNHILAIGNAIKGGIYGNQYSDPCDDTKYNFDYRNVLSTAIHKWLNCPAHSMLGQKYETLAFV